MFENLTKSNMVCLIWKFSRGGWRTAFWRMNCNRICSSVKTHILKSSRFWFFNIITHWGHPRKVMQKSNQNRNVEAKNRESNRSLSRFIQNLICLINRYITVVQNRIWIMAQRSKRWFTSSVFCCMQEITTAISTWDKCTEKCREVGGANSSSLKVLLEWIWNVRFCVICENTFLVHVGGPWKVLKNGCNF